MICSGSSLASNVFNVFMLVICPMGVRSAVMYAMQFSRNSLHPPQRIFNNTITSHLFRNPALYIQTFSSYPCARTDFRASVQCLPRSYIARNFHKINKENIVERSSFLLSSHTQYIQFTPGSITVRMVLTSIQGSLSKGKYNTTGSV